MNFQSTLLAGPSMKTVTTLCAIAALATGCAMPLEDTESSVDVEPVGASEQASTAVWKGDVKVAITGTKDTSAQ